VQILKFKYVFSIFQIIQHKMMKLALLLAAVTLRSMSSFTSNISRPIRTSNHILSSADSPSSPPITSFLSVELREASIITKEPAGVYLSSNDKNYYVTQLLGPFRINRDGGLGISLEELSSRPTDDLGIVIVNNISGNARNSGLRDNDVITMVEWSTQDVRRLEGKNYDSTIAALTTPLDDSASSVSLYVKRIKKRPTVMTTLVYSDGTPERTIKLFSGENLRRALLVRGIKLNDALARRFDSGGTGDCGAEGTCATCAVSIMAGESLLSERGVQESQIFESNPRWRMSCKCIVGINGKEGDLRILVNPRQQK